MRPNWATWSCWAVLLALLPVNQALSAENDMAVSDGAKVSLEYTLTLPDKTVADSNVGQAPITFIQGAHEIVPGLEKALEGMKAGQTKRVEVAAVDAYGPYNNKLRQTVEKDKLPKDIKVGDILQASDGRLVKVFEVNEKNAVLDLNHPLAGKALTFDVNVLKVEPGDSASRSEAKKP